MRMWPGAWSLPTMTDAIPTPADSRIPEIIFCGALRRPAKPGRDTLKVCPVTATFVETADRTPPATARFHTYPMHRPTAQTGTSRSKTPALGLHRMWPRIVCQILRLSRLTFAMTVTIAHFPAAEFLISGCRTMYYSL